MSRNRWISPALQGLLDELASSPSSVLFGRGASLAPGAQTKLASAHRAPERWSGRETGLLAVERELLRAHREEVGHLVRQVSFALTRRLPGLVERLDPQLDRAAQARALPRETLQQTQRELARLDPDQPRGVARLAQAVQLDLQDPRDAIALLRQAQRIAPHASTLQHLALWTTHTGRFQEALHIAIMAVEFAMDDAQLAASNTTAGFASFALGNYFLATKCYDAAYLSQPSVHLLAGSWLSDVMGGSSTAENKAKLLADEVPLDSRLLGWSDKGKGFELLSRADKCASGAASIGVLHALREGLH
jgi:tetratricopeptide (TPR) repeat protein